MKLKNALLLLLSFLCEVILAQTNVCIPVNNGNVFKKPVDREDSIFRKPIIRDDTVFKKPIAKVDTVFKVPIPVVDIIPVDKTVGDDIEITETDGITSNEVLQRAYLMASMEWIPLNPVPKRGGGFYDADVMVTGVPYSSVKEINTYLFQDVSYHTFMTAVHNPKSIIYTEDISKPPYHGMNCASYYGAVCSSSVMWALGIEIPYYASQIINLPDMTILEHQVVDSLKICDVIWKEGHVQMIYDLEYNADTLYRIKTFETAGNGSHTNNYTKKQFLKMWDANGYVGYRYNKLIYSTEPAVVQQWEPIKYNDDLCPTKGDRALYRTTDTVTINIFNPSYDKIVLKRGTTFISLEESIGGNHQYYNLLPGIYTVNLQKGKEGDKTSRVSFEVIDTDVNYELDSGEGNITIHFESSAKPEYAALCDIHGNSRNYPISYLDRQRGYIVVSQPLNTDLRYCKVIFKGEYGRISNVPIKVY